MKNQRGTVPRSEHEARKRASQARKKKASSSKRPRSGFIMDGKDEGRPAPKIKRAHVAQYYQLDRHQPDIAANLVRELRPWAQVAVLGARVFGDSASY